MSDQDNKQGCCPCCGKKADLGAAGDKVRAYADEKGYRDDIALFGWKGAKAAQALLEQVEKFAGQLRQVIADHEPDEPQNKQFKFAEAIKPATEDKPAPDFSDPEHSSEPMEPAGTFEDKPEGDA